MNRQEIYNTVKEHLLKQGRKSAETTDDPFTPDACKYRGPDGTKCAIGVLIPDELYSPDMEGRGIRRLAQYTDLRAYLNMLDAATDNLLYDLQTVHDGFAVLDWPKRLERVAIQHGLKP